MTKHYCQPCGRVFATPRDFANHLRVMHRRVLLPDALSLMLAVRRVHPRALAHA